VQGKHDSAAGPPGGTNLKKNASLNAESTIKLYLKHEVVRKLTTRIVEVNGFVVVHESYITEAGGKAKKVVEKLQGPSFLFHVLAKLPQKISRLLVSA
jgi:hypothetical protein